ncbi:MAG TPA: orotidine-5'-phosphate decarboxylase [bacterium]|nr:orotidine-5'-phosphate decarboxylase [bacterium]
MANLIISLDITEEEKMDFIIEKTENYVGWYKIGPVAFLKFGFCLIDKLKKKNKKIFFDFKFFDIPNTVKNAVRNCCDIGIDMISLHILGGQEMIKEAIEEREKTNKITKLIGITVLTSLTENDFGFSNIKKKVSILGENAFNWGLDGVVVGGEEISVLRKYPYLLVVPGVRLKKENDDQQRIITPKQAVKEGADFIVVGRPVYDSKEPEDCVKKILQEIKNG